MSTTACGLGGSSSNARSEAPVAGITPDDALVLQEVAVLGTVGTYRDSIGHRTVHDLRRFGDRIYVSHGDWVANTGPVLDTFIDLRDDTLSLSGFTFEDESIDHLRLGPFGLVAPGTDATEDWSFGNIYVKQSDADDWVKLRTIPGALHVFDIAFFDGALVAITTDQEVGGIAWASSDQGATWVRLPEFPNRRDAGWSATVVSLNSGLYLVTPQHGCVVYSAGNWARVDCVPDERGLYRNGTSFQENGFVIQYGVRKGGVAPLILFNEHGNQSLIFNYSARDVESTDLGLVVLTGDDSGDVQILRATRILCQCVEDFQMVANFQLPPDGKPAVPTAVEEANGSLYVGLDDGRILKVH